MPAARCQRLLEAARVAADDGAFTKAISLFKTAVRIDPHHPPAHLALANLYLALVMEKEARRAAHEALVRAVASGDRDTGAAALSFIVSLGWPADPQ